MSCYYRNQNILERTVNAFNNNNAFKNKACFTKKIFTQFILSVIEISSM